MTIRVSQNRITLEDARLERPLLKDTAETEQSVLSADTTVIDLTAGNVIHLYHICNISTLYLQNASPSGITCKITIIRTRDDSLTQRTITWPNSFKWTSNTAPTLTQTVNARDIFQAVTYDGGVTWFASTVALNYPPAMGTLFVSGLNNNGQLGLNDTVDRSSPTQVGTLAIWGSIRQGFGHNCYRRTDGTLWCCGSNEYGTLGDKTTTTRSSPVQVGALTSWANLSVVWGNTMGVRTDGTIWVWGYGGYGEIGNNTATLINSSPMQVGTRTDWAKCFSVVGGSAAIKTDGTIWAWGYNLYGQLGQNDSGESTSRSSPVQIGTLNTWKILTCYHYTKLGVKTDGTLWSLGYNLYGMLGQGDTVDRSVMTQIGTLTDWAFASAGMYAAHAIKTNGTLWGWGYNVAGEIGDGTTVQKTSPVQIGTLTDWVMVSDGYQSTSGMRKDGTVWKWGDNATYGTFGDGTTTSQSSPILVDSGCAFTSVGVINSSRIREA